MSKRKKIYIEINSVSYVISGTQKKTFSAILPYQFSFAVGPISSSKVSMASKEIPSTLRRLDKSEMSAQMRGDVFLNLSLKQVRKATRDFSPLLKLGEGGIWAVYRAVLPDNRIVTIRRAKKVVPNSIIFSLCPCLLIGYSSISYWSSTYSLLLTR
jgi:hypothetical protein